MDQATTQQKALFIKNLVTKSVASQTIEESGDAGAIGKLSQARNLVSDAQRDLDAGQFQNANAKLDEALNLVNSEARRLSERNVKGTRLQQAYEKRLNTVETFLKAYERVAGEKALSSAAQAQMGEIKNQVAEARGLAQSGRLEEANGLLDRAYKNARGDIREMREGETLTRTLNFASAAEEYHYEHDRNDSHIMLLKFAIAEKQPPSNYKQQIEALRSEAMNLRSSAENQAQAGSHADAIGTIQRSTDTLLKAIRISGIYIPG